MSNQVTFVDRLSTIGAKAMQLEGLLELCHGGGFDHFSAMNMALQESVIELAADLASQISRIASGVEHA